MHGIFSRKEGGMEFRPRRNNTFTFRGIYPKEILREDEVRGIYPKEMLTGILRVMNEGGTNVDRVEIQPAGMPYEEQFSHYRGIVPEGRVHLTIVTKPGSAAGLTDFWGRVEKATPR